MRSITAWLALPRALFQTLFPPHKNVDVVGSMVLHAKSFRLRTWVAFVLAGACGGIVAAAVLFVISSGAEGAAAGAGVVPQKDSGIVETYIMLGVELYVFPRLYDAIAASRDEAMYRGIV